MGLGLNLKASNKKEKKIWHDGKECVWVEGYKGTEPDMTCRDYQYILNQEHFYERAVNVCTSGFHFCTQLRDVFKYYELDGKNRFFKVKALIYKEDLNSHYSDKLSAKKIILTEELTFVDLKKYINEKLGLVDTEYDWKQVQEVGYEEFRRKIFVNDMKNYGYGETFITVLYDDASYDELPMLLKKARAFYEEGLNKEMSVYLLINSIE